LAVYTQAAESLVATHAALNVSGPRTLSSAFGKSQHLRDEGMKRGRLVLSLLLVAAASEVCALANRASRRAAAKKPKANRNRPPPPSPPRTSPRPTVEPAPIQRLSELFNGVLTLQDPRIWAAMKQLPEMQQIADATRAADSPRHGLGAFANAYLSADTVAAFYPVHSIGLGTQRVTAAGDEEYWREPCTTEYRALVFHEVRAIASLAAA